MASLISFGVLRAMFKDTCDPIIKPNPRIFVIAFAAITLTGVLCAQLSPKSSMIVLREIRIPFGLGTLNDLRGRVSSLIDFLQKDIAYRARFIAVGLYKLISSICAGSFIAGYWNESDAHPKRRIGKLLFGKSMFKGANEGCDV